MSLFLHKMLYEQYDIRKEGLFVTENLKILIAKNIKDNLKGYILILATFLAGVALSGVLNISSGSEEEIRLYLNDFISNVKNYSTDSSKTFNIAMNGYIKYICILFFMSLSVIGSIGTLVYIFIKGFSYGIVFISVANTMGTKSLLLFLCAIFPHSVILAPCFLAYSLFCVKKSYSVSKGIRDLKSGVLVPFLYGVLCILISGTAAIIQAYLEPILMRAMV